MVMKNLQNPFELEDEKIIESYDFTDQPSFIKGSNFQKSKSLSAAENTLSGQLAEIQKKMDEVRQRREELGESQAEQAEKARLNILTADLQDAANTIGGIGTDLGSRERQEAQRQEEGLQREKEALGQELSGLEGLERQMEASQVGLIQKEEEQLASQENLLAQQEIESQKGDPNSSISQEARATAELVLGKGAVPPDISASQLEKVYPDILENARYQQKQQDEFAKIGIKQRFQASEAEKGRLFKEAEAEKKRAFDIDMQAQKLAQDGKVKGKEIKSNQAISAGFGRRMQQAVEVFDNLAKQGFDRGSLSAGMGAVLPNFLQTSEQQQQAQAERNFVNATLRRESGAAIAESEFESAEKQYFPRAGDSPEVVEQKRRNREQVINMMKAEAGPAWDAIELVSAESESDKPKSASDDESTMPKRKKFVPGQVMVKSSSGRRIFGGS